MYNISRGASTTMVGSTFAPRRLTFIICLQPLLGRLIDVDLASRSQSQAGQAPTTIDVWLQRFVVCTSVERDVRFPGHGVTFRARNCKALQIELKHPYRSQTESIVIPVDTATQLLHESVGVSPMCLTTIGGVALQLMLHFRRLLPQLRLNQDIDRSRATFTNKTSMTDDRSQTIARLTGIVKEFTAIAPMHVQVKPSDC